MPSTHTSLRCHAVFSTKSRVPSIREEWRQREKFDPRFQWQEGYGAFSVSRWDVPMIDAYIRDQKEHHRRRTFQEEYEELLREHGIEFDSRYLW